MNKDNSDFIVKEDYIIIKDHVKEPKPVTGTKIGAITLDNPFSSPFVVFMDLFRFSLPFETTIAMEKGIEYEPIVINEINLKYNKKFTNYTNGQFYDFDIFSSLGKKFNGKLDGWDENDKIVLECKVTKINNLTKWKAYHPPKYYILQMFLYAFLTNAKEVWLAAYFLNPIDYEQKAKKDLDQKRLLVWKCQFNDKIKKWFAEKLKKVDEFLKNHVHKRISPKFGITKPCDRELLEYLNIDYSTVKKDKNV